MDLSTTYMGLELAHPFMIGASPLADDLGMVRQLVDAGASAVVMRSVFEEQITQEHQAMTDAAEASAYTSAEALSYFPAVDEFHLRPEEYLDQLAKVSRAVDVPVIASLNGTTLGRWLEYAGQMAEAGAAGIELNVYYLATDLDGSPAEIETRTVEMVTAVKRAVTIPVAVKLSPFYSSLPNFAKQLDHVGVDALVIFNRFYQPDIDVEALDVERALHLSDSSELLLRLRWLAILSGKVKASLAVTGGVHRAIDAVKASMAGAHAIQLVSVVLREGPSAVTRLRDDVSRWMEAHEYQSLRQMQGSMSLAKCPDPNAYSRANYMHMLQSWHR